MPLMSGFPVEISICQRAALSANWSRGEAKICGKKKNKKRLRQSSEGEKNLAEVIWQIHPHLPCSLLHLATLTEPGMTHPCSLTLQEQPRFHG